MRSEIGQKRQKSDTSLKMKGPLAKECRWPVGSWKRPKMITQSLGKEHSPTNSLTIAENADF